MGGYLPQVFERFGADYPAVMEAYRDLAERLHEAGPLSARERRLAKLGIAIGRESEARCHDGAGEKQVARRRGKRRGRSRERMREQTARPPSPFGRTRVERS